MIANSKIVHIHTVCGCKTIPCFLIRIHEKSLVVASQLKQFINFLTFLPKISKANSVSTYMIHSNK